MQHMFQVFDQGLHLVHSILDECQRAPLLELHQQFLRFIGMLLHEIQNEFKCHFLAKHGMSGIFWKLSSLTFSSNLCFARKSS